MLDSTGLNIPILSAKQVYGITPTTLTNTYNSIHLSICFILHRRNKSVTFPFPIILLISSYCISYSLLHIIIVIGQIIKEIQHFHTVLITELLNLPICGMIISGIIFPLPTVLATETLFSPVLLSDAAFGLL